MHVPEVLTVPRRIRLRNCARGGADSRGDLTFINMERKFE